MNTTRGQQQQSVTVPMLYSDKLQFLLQIGYLSTQTKSCNLLLGFVTLSIKLKL